MAPIKLMSGRRILIELECHLKLDYKSSLSPLLMGLFPFAQGERDCRHEVRNDFLSLSTSNQTQTTAEIDWSGWRTSGG